MRHVSFGSMYLVVQLPRLACYGPNEQNKPTLLVVDVSLVLKWLCLKLSIQVSHAGCKKHIKNSRNMACCYTYQLKYAFWLEENMSCHGSKLTNSLWEAKLTNSLGKQQLKILMCLWSDQTLANLCVRWRQGYFFFAVSFIFELEGITNT